MYGAVGARGAVAGARRTGGTRHRQRLGSEVSRQLPVPAVATRLRARLEPEMLCCTDWEGRPGTRRQHLLTDVYGDGTNWP